MSFEATTLRYGCMHACMLAVHHHLPAWTDVALHLMVIKTRKLAVGIRRYGIKYKYGKHREVNGT